MPSSFKYILFGLGLVFSRIVYAQEDLPSDIDESVVELSKYLTRNANTELQKVRAIHQWITENIEYDVDKIYDEEPTFSRPVEEILKTKTAMSVEYVELMKALLWEQGIRSHRITGYSGIIHIDTLVIPVNCDHMWIAIEIDNEWKLADPTEDAGFISYEETNKKEKIAKMWDKHEAKYRKKIAKLEMLQESGREPEFMEKVNERLAKTKDKKIIVANKISEKSNKMPDFKDKIVFYSEPSENWFLIHPDSFLNRHLPAVPFWQLQPDTMGIRTFASNPKAYKNSKRRGNYNYLPQLKRYNSYNEIERLLHEGDMGYEFNKHNAKIKSENYYLVLRGIMKSPEMKDGKRARLYRDFETSQLAPIMDTALKYADIAEEHDETYYDLMFAYFKGLYKEGKDMDKHQLRNVEKCIRWNDRAFDDLERSMNKINRDYSKWSERKDELGGYHGHEYQTDSFSVTDIPSELKT